MKILLLEDDYSISAPLKNLLEAQGYEVTPTESISEARKALREEFDLLIFDRALPDGDGLSLLAEMRAQGFKAPTVLLTAKSDVSDRVLGLDLGADDYLTKPFEPAELLARIRARLRASQAAANSNLQDENETICGGGITLDRVSRRVYFSAGLQSGGGIGEQSEASIEGRIARQTDVQLAQEVFLTLKEFQLLEYFLLNPNRALSRETILVKVWGQRFNSTRTLDVHVANLRQKFDASRFETVHGLGYRFRK